MIRLHRNTVVALITASTYIVGAFALKAAVRRGWIPPGMDGKSISAFSGLVLAVYGNFLPKSLGTYRNPESAMRMQSVLRRSGWVFTVGGLAFAVTSLAPLPDTVPLAVLGAATAYVLGYSAWAFMEPSHRKDHPTA